MKLRVKQFEDHNRMKFQGKTIIYTSVDTLIQVGVAYTLHININEHI